MAGIHPSKGVAASQANNAYEPLKTGPSDLYYPANKCGISIDTDQLNAITSEIRQVIDQCCPYDPSVTTNLLDGMKRVVCDYTYQIGSGPPDPPTGEVVVSTSLIENADGTTTVCEVKRTLTPCPSIYIDRDTGAQYIYDRDNEQWVESYSQIRAESIVEMLSQDTGNDLGVGTDGLLYLKETVTTIGMQNSNLIFTDEQGAQTLIPLGGIASTVSVIASQGDGTYIHDNGTGLETVIVTTSGNAANILKVDADNGSFLTAQDAVDAIVADAVALQDLKDALDALP